MFSTAGTPVCCHCGAQTSTKWRYRHIDQGVGGNTIKARICNACYSYHNYHKKDPPLREDPCVMCSSRMESGKWSKDADGQPVCHRCTAANLKRAARKTVKQEPPKACTLCDRAESVKWRRHPTLGKPICNNCYGQISYQRRKALRTQGVPERPRNTRSRSAALAAERGSDCQCEDTEARRRATRDMEICAVCRVCPLISGELCGCCDGSKKRCRMPCKALRKRREAAAANALAVKADSSRRTAADAAADTLMKLPAPPISAAFTSPSALPNGHMDTIATLAGMQSRSGEGSPGSKLPTASTSPAPQPTIFTSTNLPPVPSSLTSSMPKELQAAQRQAVSDRLKVKQMEQEIARAHMEAQESQRRVGRLAMEHLTNILPAESAAAAVAAVTSASLSVSNALPLGVPNLSAAIPAPPISEELTAVVSAAAAAAAVAAATSGAVPSSKRTPSPSVPSAPAVPTASGKVSPPSVSC